MLLVVTGVYVQQEFPGIKGFSAMNLKNMRHFYEEYQFLQFGQAVPVQIGDEPPKKIKRRSPKKPLLTIGQAVPAQIDIASFTEDFLLVGFTHHLLLLQKCRDLEERLFYLRQIIENQWSSRVLEYHLEAKLYKSQGKIQTNFSKTLPVKRL